MNAFELLMLVVLVGGLGTASYLLYLNLPGQEIDFQIPERKILNESIEYSSSQQFYKNMRFSDSEITYEIASLCSSEKEKTVAEAFAILEDRTVLRFKPVSLDPEIMVTCSDLEPEPKFKNHFVAGEGGPTEIINTSLYAVINSGKISLFRDSSCENPNIALHEILHVLGFDHNDNPDSILYPVLDCNQELDEFIIREINSLYSVESLPDLKIDEIDASKSGRYLHFEIEIINQGLRRADSVFLDVYSDGDFIKSFEIGEITVGTKKILTVENVNLKTRTFEEVSFVIRLAGSGKEILEDNNIIRLVLANQ